MGDIIDRPALFAGEQRAEPTALLLDWPGLDQLRLDEQALSERMTGIGGSDANIILSGDREKILGLWREKRGEQPAADLSDNLAVMLGCWTEPFNRLWFEKLTAFFSQSLAPAAAAAPPPPPPASPAAATEERAS